jgi:acyl-CoA reductase-like NAD-dependent aldehyde dehydrogenase
MTAAVDWSARAESLKVPQTILIGGRRQAAESGKSGFGRNKSLHALEKYLQLKTTWIKL